MTDTLTAPATKGDAATIAKFFGVTGKAAMEAIRGLTTDDKVVLAEGIRDGSLTY